MSLKLFAVSEDDELASIHYLLYWTVNMNMNTISKFNDLVKTDSYFN